jgi:hypothetical protein
MRAVWVFDSFFANPDSVSTKSRASRREPQSRCPGFSPVAAHRVTSESTAHCRIGLHCLQSVGSAATPQSSLPRQTWKRDAENPNDALADRSLRRTFKLNKYIMCISLQIAFKNQSYSLDSGAHDLKLQM